MQFAVIGQGFVWPRHKKAIENNGCSVAMTCDKEFHPSRPDFTDWLTMIHSDEFEEIDAVSICTPNHTHSVMAREISRLGKLVLCEKPLTIFQDYEGLEDVKTVLQLRYNPLVKHLRSTEPENIEIYVKAYREPKYWDSWKGDETRSGGILHNMCVHYIDLLIHLLGLPVRIRHRETGYRHAKGTVEFASGIGAYDISLEADANTPTIREITVDGTKADLEGATIPLSDTGEVIDLHTEVYKHFIRGEGLGLSEARKSLDLVAELHPSV